MLFVDDLEAGLECHGRFSNSRIQHYWDPDRILGGLPAQTMNLKTRTAWDVCHLHPPDHPWDTAPPPAPKFWMHQLDEARLLFYPHAPKKSVQEMIERCIRR